MNFSESVAIATSSLWAHKLRSVLTLLSVVIGVAAVIAVVSLINGANQYVATRVFRLGGAPRIARRVVARGAGADSARVQPQR
jgi:ABC-type antimicrobial peptide transport system permease subunit